MRTHGQRDSGAGGQRDNISRGMHSNAHRKSCDAMRCGSDCMSFALNEVKFTVAHSLSKTKSLSSCVGGVAEGSGQVSWGRYHGRVPCVLHARGKDAAAAAAVAVEYVSRLQKLNQCKSINGSPVSSFSASSSSW